MSAHYRFRIVRTGLAERERINWHRERIVDSVAVGPSREMDLSRREVGYCSICGQEWRTHSEPVLGCIYRVENIVRRCYSLTITFSRPVVRAILAEEFPEAHPELLISIERGMTVEVPLPRVYAAPVSPFQRG